MAGGSLLLLFGSPTILWNMEQRIEVFLWVVRPCCCWRRRNDFDLFSWNGFLAWKRSMKVSLGGVNVGGRSESIVLRRRLRGAVVHGGEMRLELFDLAM